MLNGILGKKIGMTQVFSGNKAVAVTVIDVYSWLVTAVKNKERDGYEAIQFGLPRDKYLGKEFSPEWLKQPNKYFVHIKEVRGTADSEVAIGQQANFTAMIEPGQKVDVFGTTKGKGFQGVVKRHGFSGGRASHGPRFGRIPGSVGFMRSQGRIIKGKRLPGRMGMVQRVVRQLPVMGVESANNVILVKGAVPGVAGSLVFVRKV